MYLVLISEEMGTPLWYVLLELDYVLLLNFSFGNRTLYRISCVLSSRLEVLFCHNGPGNMQELRGFWRYLLLGQRYRWEQLKEGHFVLRSLSSGMTRVAVLFSNSLATLISSHCSCTLWYTS